MVFSLYREWAFIVIGWRELPRIASVATRRSLSFKFRREGK